ncbi:MAG TPA: hypothetical protein VMA73_07465 [Streptosporangiaceae bacterium]|nr:hypothetical protein [Streptosporangiaceae bacterium]
MSLPTRQQRTLDGIAETLRLTEPRLAVMFAIFTRLTRDEPTPFREQLAARRRVAWPARRLRPSGRHGNRRGSAWQHLLIISQLAIAVIALVVLTCVSSHGAAGCGDRVRPHPDAISAPRQPACLAPGSAGSGLAGK